MIRWYFNWKSNIRWRQRYFDYQLGRMHAVELNDVKEYENAISREGRVSVAMDSYFLRFDRMRALLSGAEDF